MSSGGTLPDGNMTDDDDDEVPDLVENFGEVFNDETATEAVATAAKPAEEEWGRIHFILFQPRAEQRVFNERKFLKTNDKFR